jgi:PAS domain S-box-containing protein
MADKDERVTSWNSFMEKMLGMEREDLHLKPLHSFYPPEEWAKIRSCNIRQTGLIEHLETVMIRKDGSLVDVDISISVLKDGNGNVTGSIGITRDISARKRAEEALREANQKLQNMNNQMADFVANVAHEIRNPLAIIKYSFNLFLDELKEGITADQKELLNITKRTMERLFRLVTDLLDLSRIEAGRMVLHMEEVDIVALLEEALAGLEVEISRKRHTLKKNIPYGASFVQADRDKLNEVIINLLNNAIKYTPSGGEITVGFEKDDREVRVEIADNGPGIPPEYQSKIFDKFERINAEIQEGSGLGLPIAKDIVELHQGKIWVESEYGKGSKFIFTMPRSVHPHPTV